MSSLSQDKLSRIWTSVLQKWTFLSLLNWPRETLYGSVGVAKVETDWTQILAQHNLKNTIQGQSDLGFGSGLFTCYCCILFMFISHSSRVCCIPASFFLALFSHDVTNHAKKVMNYLDIVW